MELIHNKTTLLVPHQAPLGISVEHSPYKKYARNTESFIMLNVAVDITIYWLSMRENKSLLSQLSIHVLQGKQRKIMSGHSGKEKPCLNIVHWFSFLIAPLLTWIMGNE